MKKHRDDKSIIVITERKRAIENAIYSRTSRLDISLYHNIYRTYKYLMMIQK